MKSVMLNMMMLGIVGGLIGGEASAAFFKKSNKVKTYQVQDDESEGTGKRILRKTKSAIKGVASKTKKGLTSAKDSVKTFYKEKRDQSREKSRQKALEKEGSPMNTMFESKAEVEYNLKYLNDIRKNFKSASSSVEKTANQVENAFVVKSFLFETATYLKLLDKFSEQYMEGMSQLKKAKKYNSDEFTLAMNAFQSARSIIGYAKTQRGVISYIQDLVTPENLKNVSEDEASAVSKKIQKLSENLKQSSDDVKQLKDIVSTINDQTIYDDEDFKSLETDMLSCIKKETSTLDDIPNMLKNVSSTIQKSSNSQDDQADMRRSSENLSEPEKEDAATDSGYESIRGDE